MNEEPILLYHCPFCKYEASKRYFAVRHIKNCKSRSYFNLSDKEKQEVMDEAAKDSTQAQGELLRKYEQYESGSAKLHGITFKEFLNITKGIND